MQSIEIPRETVLQARIARKIIQEWNQLTETERAFQILENSSAARDYAYNLRFLEDYNATYWNDK